MDADKAVTATFDKDSDHSVLVDTPTKKYYPTITAAYVASSLATTIKVWGIDFTENLLLDKNIDVTIKGWFNAGYSSCVGITILHGTVTVGKGSLNLDYLVVQ